MSENKKNKLTFRVGDTLLRNIQRAAEHEKLSISSWLRMVATGEAARVRRQRWEP